MKKVLLVLIMMFLLVVSVNAAENIPDTEWNNLAENLAEIQDFLTEIEVESDWQSKTYRIHIDSITWTGTYKIVKYSSYMIVIQRVATGEYLVLFNYEKIMLVEAE